MCYFAGCEICSLTLREESSSNHCGGAGSSPGQIMWDFLIDKVILGQVFSEYFCFPLKSFDRLLYTHHCLSSETGIIGQIVAGEPSELSLTPLQE
jgi:hypothetical protein